MRRDRDVDNIDVIDAMNGGVREVIHLLCSSFGGNAVPAPVPAPAAVAPMPSAHARMQEILTTRGIAVAQGLQSIIDRCDAKLAKI